MRAAIVLGSMFCWAAAGVQAQEPHILGTWKLNVEASRLPAPPPQVHVRQTLSFTAEVTTRDGQPLSFLFVFDRTGSEPPR